MGFLGKDVRMNRLFGKDGRYLGITVDHAMARGVLPGLDHIGETLKKIVAGCPDAITMHKGIAERCFAPYAGKIPLILKCSTFSPYQPDLDTVVADIDEAVRFGADAASIGCMVCGDTQPGQIAAMAKMSKEANNAGMPLFAHIYPRGNRIAKEDFCKEEFTAYAARIGAELGIDLVKTNYTGDLKSFEQVAQSCPTRLAVAGGQPGKDIRYYMQMTHDVLEAGAVGVTYGRFVFQYRDPASLIRALASIIHGNASVKEAMELLEHLENSGENDTFVPALK